MLAAHWSDMKDGKTIKDIVPFFFSFGQDKVFCFLFSIAEQKREEKHGRYFLGEFHAHCPYLGSLEILVVRACSSNLVLYSCFTIPNGSSSIQTDLLHSSFFSSFSNRDESATQTWMESKRVA